MDRDTIRGARAGVLFTAVGVALLTAFLAPWRSDLGVLDEGLILLLFTLLVSAFWGRAAGVFGAVLSNLALNFFFIEPLHRFDVADLRNVVSLAVFLVVSVVGSSLLAAARDSAAEARRSQAQTEALLKLSRAMIGQSEPQGALDALCRQATEAFEAPGASVLAQRVPGWEVLASAGAAAAERDVSPEERAMAERAVRGRSIEVVGMTGLRTSRISRVVTRQPTGTRNSVIMAPLLIGGAAPGVLRLDGPLRSHAFAGQPQELLLAFASEAALAVQRLELARTAERSEVLEEANEAKTNLMLSISHDLKTPLAAIKTSVSSLLDQTVRWSSEDINAFLETIDSQVDYLNRTISDILDLNRLESGAVRPLLKKMAAIDLLQDAAERCAAATAGREVDIDVPRDLRVDVDPSLVVQALANLIDNAARYSAPGGAIRLSARKNGDAVELAVADEGPGIPAEDLPRVFDRFYSARRTAGEAKGSGLGLALVKAFATLSGGAAAVESGPGGSRFVLRFPSVASVTA